MATKVSGFSDVNKFSPIIKNNSKCSMKYGTITSGILEI